MKKIAVLLMLLVCGTVFADNMVVNYLSRWIDETRVENAIGKLLITQFTKDIAKDYNIQEDKALSQRFAAYVEKCGAKMGAMEFKVFVIDSDISDEILLPGGILIVTKGFLQSAVKEEQKEFILARNAYLTFKKQPLVLIKHEGIYPNFIDAIRTPEAKLSDENMRGLLTSYLGMVSKMNHKEADIQGALLTTNPEKTRISAIEMLSQFTVKVWPRFPLDTIGFPSRIAELKNIKLPDNKL